MNVLVILQGPPYGDEHAFNGLRPAGALAKREDVTVRVQARRSSLEDVADWVLWADKTVTF